MIPSKTGGAGARSGVRCRFGNFGSARDRRINEDENDGIVPNIIHCDDVTPIISTAGLNCPRGQRGVARRHVSRRCGAQILQPIAIIFDIQR